MTAGAVSVGPGTVVGFGVGGLAFVEACVRIVLGDASADDTGTIVQGVMGGLMLIVTVVGRQWQAGQVVKATATVKAAEMDAASYTPLSAVTYNRDSTSLGGEPVDPVQEFPGGSVPTGVGPEVVARMTP